MHLLNIEPDAAAELIAEITKHVPAGAGLGHLCAATEAGLVLASDGHGACVWGLDDAGAWRQSDLGDGWHEITRWYWGDEETRRIVREEDAQHS